MTVRIKDMSVYDRPRERLIKYGGEYLSDSELLSILIGSGINKYSAKDLASIILKEVEGISNLSKCNYSSLIKIPGIKMSKACIILATIEIAKRFSKRISDINNIRLNNSKIVYEYYNELLKDEKQEFFYCVYLDNNKRVISNKLLFKGTLNYSLIHPREVFKEAYIQSASAIICVHNHPSGNINPSHQDIESTNNLVEIGKLHGIKLLDHIIIGNNNYYSFLENNKISL